MFQLKVVFLLISLTIYTFVKGNRDLCSISFGNEPPQIVRGFGSKTILLKPKPESTQNFDVGESISAYCESEIEVMSDSSRYYEKLSTNYLNLKCMENQQIVYLNFNDHEESTSYMKLYCSRGTNIEGSLYESEKILPNCEKFISYGIGDKLPYYKQIINAAFCYDLDNLDLKFINFIAYRKKSNIFKNETLPTDLQSITLDKYLSSFDSYFSFMNKNEFQKAFDNLEMSNRLLELKDFDFENLIQLEPIQKNLQNIEYILNTVWWRNLRLGNWKFFLEILRDRAEHVTYNVFLGKSGKIEIPALYPCNKSQTLNFEYNELAVHAAEYIWLYLKSIPNSEELVVIGYNSPFYKSAKLTIFCNDIWDKIDWLKNSPLNKIRMMPARGLIFVCHPEEVSKKFENFPYENENNNYIIDDALPVTTDPEQ